MERHAAYFLKITSSMSYKNFCFQNVNEKKDHAEDTSLKVVKYARTPVMSTYLVAFVVGEFDFVEGRDANGVTIRVYTPKGRDVRGQFALEVSLAKCMTNFSQFTLISTITFLNVCHTFPVMLLLRFCCWVKESSPYWYVYLDFFSSCACLTVYIYFNPLTPKIWLLILPSSCLTFPCKSVMRTWC